MKRFSLLSLFAATFVLTLVSFDAEARRLGGARSSGITRDSSFMKREAVPAKPATPAQQATTAGAKPAGATPQPSGMSRWMGPLAGLAAGLGLAALLSHFGLGEGMASFLMLALLVFAAIFLFRMLMRKKEPEQRMAYAGAPEPMRFEPASMPAGGSAAPAAAGNVPAGFDSEGFLRQAKLNFLRLQGANDAGNMDDIRQFTSPEMFAEVQMQYEERGRAPQHTDVIAFDAHLLDFTTEEKREVASVRFHGRIREEANAPEEDFDEVWHLVRPTDGSTGWIIAGIQQLN